VRDETLRDKLIREEQIDCRYFTGIQNKCCEAGVNYDQLTEDGKYVLPCKKNFVAINRDPAICGSFKTRTLEEATVYADERLERGNRTLAAVAAAHEHADKQGFKKGKGGTGSMPCPTGCGGTLRYSVAGINGHMHAGCTTNNCVRWME
jgi:hypothetical protein